MGKIGLAEFERIKENFLTIYKDLKTNAIALQGTEEGKMIMEALTKLDRWFLEEFVAKFKSE